MKLPESLRSVMGELRRRAHILKDQWNQGRRATVLQLVRPQLGDTPPLLRPVLEPLVAFSAATVLAGLVAAGALSLAAFVLAGAMIYAILTYVFGIDVDLRVPATGF
jgi:hypothetical protein